MNQNDKAALEARPRIARNLIANWRLNAMCKGEELVVYVVPGEWPAGAPTGIVGVPVQQDADSLIADQPGFLLAMGRLNGSGEWLAAFFAAFAPVEDMGRADQALVTMFARVTGTDDDILVQVGDLFSADLP